MEKTPQKLQSVAAKKNNHHNVRLTEGTWKILTELLKKINGKDRGRSIKADEVIALALSLITPGEIKELQDGSLSNADRLELKYQKYIQENSYMSKDDFLGRLMKGELNPKAE